MATEPPRSTCARVFLTDSKRSPRARRRPPTPTPTPRRNTEVIYPRSNASFIKKAIASTTKPIPTRPSQRSLCPSRRGERIPPAPGITLAPTDLGFDSGLRSLARGCAPRVREGMACTGVSVGVGVGVDVGVGTGRRPSERAPDRSLSTRPSSRVTRSSRSGFSCSDIRMFPSLFCGKG